MTGAPSGTGPASGSDRLVWIDWLKVIVVFGVFLYHAAQPFVITTWVVTNSERSIALSAFAGFGYLFGMPLMFLLAGAAAWLSLGRRSLGTYVGLRVRRLLVPLVLGILLLTPLQWWLASVISGSSNDLAGAFGWFFSTMRFEPTFRWFGDYGLHLWFLAFLFAYSVISLPVLGRLRDPGGTAVLGRLAGLPTGALLVALVGPLLASQWLLRIPAPAYRDWADFALWLGFFLIGVVLVAERRLLDRIVAIGPWLLVAGLVLAGAFIPIESAGRLWDLEATPGLDAASLGYIALRTLVAGALVGGSLWIGVRWLTWRPPALGWASRAVLPFYVLHHPVTVAVAAMVVQWPIGLWAKYAAIATLALVGTLAVTELVMRTAAGRSLFGMARPLPVLATDGTQRPAPLGEV